MEESREESRQIRLQRQMGLLVTVLLVLAVALCLYTTVQVLSNGYVNLGGIMMFRVVTGSMEPTIPVGALLVTQQVDIESIQMNDIICFRTQVSEIWGKIVTHRVVGIWESEVGGILLETKGDANLVADGYFVEQTNFVGKVIWHTGDGSVLANILSLITSKIGFLGCIVFPSLLLSAMILKDCVGNIRQELQMALEMEQMQQRQKEAWEDDPLCGMTQEEYNEMYERIRAELMEELKYFVELQKEQKTGSQVSETE
ncbi:MAG: signal peptidase I [Oscillospiraceae bacterium]|nr:signal peptidase I [Oscillospiraceae bacterium]